MNKPFFVGYLVSCTTRGGKNRLGSQAMLRHYPLLHAPFFRGYEGVPSVLSKIAGYGEEPVAKELGGALARNLTRNVAKYAGQTRYSTGRAYVQQMEMIVVEKPSFTVIGILGRGAARDAVDWIPPLWQVANSRFAEVSGLAKRDAEGNLIGIWGAMSDVQERFERWGEEGKYLAGVEAVDDAVAPEGWTRWVVPAFRYVAVPCTLDSYKETMQRILTDYLPSRGYTIAGAIQEYYRPGDREGHLSLYVPIERL